MKLYKIVGLTGEPLHGGSGAWHLPAHKGRPAKWMEPVTGDVQACRNGYHLVKPEGLMEWLPSGPALLCEAEGRDDSDCDDGKKTAFREARIVRIIGPLNDLTMRLAAADFAWRVLPLFEKERPDDDRPRKAIIAARDFAHGRIDAAARDAARDAAWDAAWAAARDAAWAARDAARAAAWAAGDAARAAAWAAARAAAGDAVRDAAGDAVRDAERSWQGKRLLKIVSQHAP